MLQIGLRTQLSTRSVSRKTAVNLWYYIATEKGSVEGPIQCENKSSSLRSCEKIYYTVFRVSVQQC